jgi:hypothetical protein
MVNNSIREHLSLPCPWNFESRDGIFLGGRLWHMRFLIRLISANDRINWVQPVDIGQTLVNLGHHLETQANNH